jgi:phenylalanine-4-hydroxylase
MTESTHARIPGHLRKYIVDQNYERYNSLDQAVWRYIMRQLRSFLSEHAHESYLEGLEKTGITVERIPAIEEIDRHLNGFGWGAVPVSGFIPPAAFMEFQSIGVLPIASDMRTLDHLLYTPAPDIVHEAAGHAPILVHPEYARYLRQYGEVARHSILSKEDLDQYEAIRILSDIKEDPRSSRDEIAKAERRLNEVNAAMTSVSEAALLSRMNWWTAEYGLIGDLKNPRIFGAGLLSSAGEARSCLSPKVRKIELSVDCVDYSYDITEPQPQLFVTRDFAQLGEVLEQLAGRLSYRQGGVHGLKRAIAARTVNSVQLTSGVQISGVLKEFLPTERGDAAHLRFEGPCQLSSDYAEIAGQGVARHAHGFSSPVGFWREHPNRCLSTFSPADLERGGIKRGARARLQFTSGVTVDGVLKDWTYANEPERLQILTWTDCRVTMGEQILFDPAWGEYDMAVGCAVTSVFGGPADRSKYGQNEDFAAKRVPSKSYSPAQRKTQAFFNHLRELRGRKGPGAVTEFRKHLNTYLSGSIGEWLAGVELLELSHQLQVEGPEREALLRKLNADHQSPEAVGRCVRDGVALATRP